MFDLVTFDRVTENLGLDNDVKRAERMGMSNGVISRIRAGKAKPGRKFIERLDRVGLSYDMVFPRRVKQEA